MELPGDVVRGVLCDYLEPWEFAQLMRVSKYYYKVCQKYREYNYYMPLKNRNYKWAVWWIKKEKQHINNYDSYIEDAVVQKKWAFVKFLDSYCVERCGQHPVIYSALVTLVRENRFEDIEYIKKNNYLYSNCFLIRLCAQFGKPVEDIDYYHDNYYHYGLCAKGDESVLQMKIQNNVCYTICVLHKHYDLAEKIKPINYNITKLIDLYTTELLTIENIQNKKEYILEAVQYICADYNITADEVVETLDDYIWYGDEIECHIMLHYYTLAGGNKEIGMLLGIYYNNEQLLRDSCTCATKAQLNFALRVATEKKNQTLIDIISFFLI